MPSKCKGCNLLNIPTSRSVSFAPIVQTRILQTSAPAASHLGWSQSGQICAQGLQQVLQVFYPLTRQTRAFRQSKRVPYPGRAFSIRRLKMTKEPTKVLSLDETKSVSGGFCVMPFPRPCIPSFPSLPKLPCKPIRVPFPRYRR